MARPLSVLLDVHDSTHPDGAAASPVRILDPVAADDERRASGSRDRE